MNSQQKNMNMAEEGAYMGGVKDAKQDVTSESEKQGKWRG
jgi:hypothetical protein